MAKQLNKYLPIWNKYKPAIVSYLKAAKEKGDEQQYQLSPQEFTSIGDRDKSGYAFKLEMTNGVVTNDIGGTAVARDLFQILNTSPTAVQLFKDNTYSIRVDKNFKMYISCEASEEPAMADSEDNEENEAGM